MLRLVAIGVVLSGCSPEGPTLAPVRPAPEPEPASAAAAPSDPPPSAAHAVRFEPAPEGELPAIVLAFAERARAEGRTPLVYVGATWCEPCQYFHAAAERGELDGELPPLALLELDRDRDGARIDAAGYGSRMIPLFAVPGPDGRGTGAQIEGSIHGPGSPMQIVPRLRALIGVEP